MEFQNYDPGQHEELVPEFFSDTALEPQESARFREAVEQAFQDVKGVLGAEADFSVVVARTDMRNFDDGTPDGLYFRGYSLGKDFHEHAETNIVFLAAPEPGEYEYWKAGLKNMFVHEEAHQEFYRIFDSMDHVIWESMVFEGHALVREKTVREEKDYMWKGDPREYDGSAEDVIQVLDKNREWEGDRYNRENTSSIFSNRSDWEGIGYVIAQEVYEDILDRNDMEIDEPLSRSRGWLREQVEKSIRELY